MKIVYKIPLLRSAVRAWQFRKFQRQWRKQNMHNQTVACSVFPLNIVTVGNGTYGELHVMSFYPAKERLIIGNYVSMAPNIHFILGGNHQVHTLFTYPILSRIEGKHCQEDAYTKGAIVVEDEVWIGFGATILSGVTIGKGAIVAAKAVVTKDVPPYTIVAGNPAKVIKKRLPDSVIKQVSKLSLNDIPRKQWSQLKDLLYTPIDEHTDINILLTKIQKDGNTQ